MVDAKMNRSAAERDDDEIDLGALLRILFGRKLLISTITLLGVCAGAVLTLSQPNRYAADALVQLEEKASGIPGLEALSGFSETPRTAAEVEILRSRLVIGDVVDALDLTLHSEPVALPILRRLPLVLPSVLVGTIEGAIPFAQRFNWGDAAITVEQFDATQSVLEDGVSILKTSQTSYTATLPGGRTLDGVVGEVLRDDIAKLRLLVVQLDGRIGRTFEVYRSSRIAAITEVKSRLSVSELGRGTSILSITYQDTSPYRAQRILQGVTRSYLKQNIARNSADIEQSLAFVEQQLPQARARADKAQNKLNEYLRSQNAVDLERESESLLDRLTQLEAELSKLVLEEERVSRRYMPNHPVYEDLLLRKSQIEQQIASFKLDTESLPETQKEVFNLRQSVEINQEIYRQFLNRSQELGVARASSIGNVRVVDQAVAKRNPVAPRTSRALLLGWLIGLLFGVGYALMLFFFRKTVDTLADLEPLGLSLYGVINQIPGLPSQRPKRGEVLKRLSETEGNDAPKEAFKSIRTSLHFGLADKLPKALAITSSQPGDGKSFVSYNIAEAIGASGQKTILIDTDMRRGYLHRTFGISQKKPGLSEYLAGDVELTDASYEVADNLILIPRGQVPPNPSELLMSSRFKDLVKTLDDTYDVCVYDTAPVLAVTDPLIVFRHVSIRLALVRHGKTELGAISAVKNICDKEDLPLDGLIVNGFDAKRAQSYGYGNYEYGGYTGAYAYEADKNET